MKKLLSVLGLLAILTTTAHAQELFRALTETLHSGAQADATGKILKVEGWATVSVQVDGITTATVTFQVSNDAALGWENLTCIKSSNGSSVSSLTADGAVACPVAGYKYFKAPISGYSDGTITVKAMQTTAASSRGGGSGSGVTTIASGTELPATCTPGDLQANGLFLDTDDNLLYFCPATDTFTQVNPGESQTLDDVFDQGKTIDGANSLANAFRVGDGTTPICIYTDATLGPIIKPCTDSNTRTYILNGFTWSLYDIEGDAAMLTVDPDAASVNAMYQFGSGYRPLKSIWLDAGAASTDGAQCAAPTESSNTVVKTWTIVCADHDSGAMYWKVGMPDAWDGGTVTFELQIHQVGASTNTIEIDFAAMCYSHDEAASAFASPPTGEQAASITLTADNDILHGTTSAVTVAGTTCAGGDTLFVTGQVDATASHADIATAVEILGVKMEYAVSSLSD